MSPRGNNARPDPGSHGRRPDPTVDFIGRPACERAVGERARCGSQTSLSPRGTTPASTTSQRRWALRRNRSLIHATTRKRGHAPTRQRQLTVPIGDLPDGRHSLTVSATDAAGNSSAAVRDVYVDNTAPDPVAPHVIGGDAWRRTNQFGIAWTNPVDRAAPIVRAHWKICTTDGSCPSRGQRDGTNIQGLPSLRVPAPGEYRLHVWLQDAAGNAREESAAISAALRFDPEPPALTFEPTDITDPLRVVVNAVDSHSGVAHGEIEMRATGTSTWHGLATERRGSLLVAHVDDERFRKGAYEFRAHAVDQAGNEASTGRRADGSAATLRLPARTDTRLAVGVPRLVVRRKVERRKGHRRVIRRRIRRLDSSVIARAGRLVRLDGFLATASGQPIDGATIEALEKRSRGTLVPVGFATTGTDGKFRFKREGGAEPRNAVPLWRFGTNWRSDDRLHDARPCGHVDPPGPTSSAEWATGALQWASTHATAPNPGQARRDAGLLPGPLAYLLHRSSGRQRPLALPVPLRRHGGASDVPVPRSTARRRRLPVHKRQFRDRGGRRTWKLTRS